MIEATQMQQMSSSCTKRSRWQSSARQLLALLGAVVWCLQDMLAHSLLTVIQKRVEVGHTVRLKSNHELALFPHVAYSTAVS